MNKSILIVGAGFGQLPAIAMAKKMGLQIVVVDKNIDAPGMKFADFPYDVNILDFDGVLNVAKRHSVSGAMTMQSDLPVPTIGYINDNLGLVGVGLKVAQRCSNKIETRKRLKEKNCAQPNFFVVSNLAEAKKAAGKLGYPFVIKAPDSSGSRGVVKVDNDGQIECAVSEAFKFTRGLEVLAEEFVVGLEFGAQTFSVDGVCEKVLIHNDTMSAPPYMIPIGHSFPFKYLSPSQLLEVENDIKNAVESLGIENGPANVDLILDKKNDRVKIIEIGARIGATCLPELVEYYTGINWVEATIKNALGMEVDLAETRRQPTAALIIESPEDGKFKHYEIDFREDEPGLLELEVTAKENEIVNKLRKGTDRIGKIIVESENAELAEQLAAKLRSKIKINVE